MNTKITRLVKAITVAVGLIALANSACADEVKILTTGILKGAFTEIAAKFERDTGHKVSMSWGPSSGNSPEASQVRIRNGEQFDVLIMVSNGMDELIRDGYFVGMDRRDVAISKIGVGVKLGHPLPDISTENKLRQALLDAKSIGYSEGASGSYVANVLLKRLGIADEVAAKSKVILGRKFVGDAIADGEVEIGIQQVSELRLDPQVVVVGPLPDNIQKSSIVSGAVSSRSTRKDAAKSFLEFLSSGFATEAMVRSGLDIPKVKAQVQ